MRNDAHAMWAGCRNGNAGCGGRRRGIRACRRTPIGQFAEQEYQSKKSLTMFDYQEKFSPYDLQLFVVPDQSGVAFGSRKRIK